MSERHNRMPLVLQNAGYRQQQLHLLKNISFTLESSGITVILGHNGAGKSLLLKLCHGVIMPSNGTVHWGQERPSIFQYWRTLLLQRPTFLQRSVEGNLHFVMKVAGIPREQYDERCAQALTVCGLQQLRRRNSRVLSGGEQQRLSIARACVLQAKVVLLDEPTVALDPKASAEIETLVTVLRESGTKIIMTTHDLAQAKRLANDILFMHQGTLLKQSSVDTFFNTETHEHIVAFLQHQLV